MAINWTQFTTHIIQPISVPIDLTGLADSAVTFRVRPQANGGGTFAPISGSVHITATGTSSTIQVTFAAADVALPNSLLYDVQVTFGDGSKWTSYPQSLTIANA